MSDSSIDINTPPDLSDAGISISKLDADQYSVDDIDGVTESVFGSGNMAYANLQARQTDAAILINEATTADSNPALGDFHTQYFSTEAPDVTNVISVNQAIGSGIPTDIDRPLEANNAARLDNPGADGHFSSATVGALGLSTLSSDAGISPSSNFGFNGGFGDLSSGTNINPVTSNVTNIITNTADDTIQNVVNNLTQTVENVTNLGDQIINNLLEGDVGDVVTIVNNEISNLTETVNNLLQDAGITEITNQVTDITNNITETVNNLLQDSGVTNITNQVTETINNILHDAGVMDITDQITNVTDNVTDTVNTQINNVTETVNTLLQDTGITDITNQVTDITNNVADTVTNTVSDVLDNALGDGGIKIDLDNGILDTLGTDLGVAVDDGISGNLGTDLLSGNTVDLVGDLTGLDIPLIGDTGVDVGFNLLNSGDGASDGNDISIAGIDTPDISLDPVEGIVGDIDIQIDVSNLTDPDALIQGAGDLLSSFDNIDLANPGDALGILGDQGAAGGLDLVAGDTEFGHDFGFDAGSIVDDPGSLLDASDSALDIGDAIDLLNQGGDSDGIAESLNGTLGGLGGVSDAGAGVGWTESLIDAVGGLVDDVVNTAGNMGETLPDPVASVSEGLGALHVTPDLHHGLGGLFG